MPKAILQQCPICGCTKLNLIEYAYDHPEHFDGVSEIVCTNCQKRFGRWSGRELKAGEFEKHFGDQKHNSET